ncbi:MAG: MerR family transcriptional regulator [Rhodobacter sp.]|nr:MerR family transcriptional regulator [Rhodobacter sp.]
MKKAPDAFRTISEVSEILETPAHVLRFWESKFYQIRPVKRAGGRRYYRPDDVALINGIRVLLQDQGMTIRGVQRILQEQGVKHVAGLGSPLPLDDLGDDDTGMRDADAVDGIDVDAIEDAEIVTEEADLFAGAVVTPLAPEEHAPVDAPAPDIETVIDEAAPAAPAEPEFEASQPDLAAVDANGAPEDEDVMSESETLAPPEVEAVEPEGTLAAREPAVAEKPAAPAVDQAPDMTEVSAADDSVRLARTLRGMPRGSLGRRRDSLDILARRIDTLLERMSEASGAGRW